jgi:hypothetical protein
MRIKLDVWLYGELRKYAKISDQMGFANFEMEVEEGYRMRDLLASLEMPTTARGITFVSGDLSALPGFQPDLDHVFKDSDRVSLFDLHSMFPFHYRNGAAMIDEMETAVQDDPQLLLHHNHSSDQPESNQPGE